jgi:hypothetical protein
MGFDFGDFAFESEREDFSSSLDSEWKGMSSTSESGTAEFRTTE